MTKKNLADTGKLWKKKKLIENEQAREKRIVMYTKPCKIKRELFSLSVFLLLVAFFLLFDVQLNCDSLIQGHSCVVLCVFFLLLLCRVRSENARIRCVINGYTNTPKNPTKQITQLRTH